MYACNYMRFLPDGRNRTSDAVNPIKLNLKAFPIQMDGTFEWEHSVFYCDTYHRDILRLPLRLINIPAKTKVKQTKKSLFYRLDERIAAHLHPTPYDPHFFRLACVLERDNTIHWDTLCLSDYIRPSKTVEETVNGKISMHFILEGNCWHKCATIKERS